MKRILNILALAITLMVVQACGSKAEKKETSDVVIVETPVVAVVLTADEKRAQRENEIAAWEENRRLAIEELYKSTPTYTNSKGKVVYYKAEVEPRFEGGKDAMIAFLKDNLVYPPAAQEKQLEGTVFVDFIVEADGSIHEAFVAEETNENVDQSFRDEAIRVVSSMPKWVPGRQRGETVDVKFSIPITFQL